MSFIYIDDLVKGTLEFLEEEESKLSERIYNIQSISCTVHEAYSEIKKIQPDFKIDYDIVKC